MNMDTRRLYRISAVFVAAVCLVCGTVYFFQRRLTRSLPHRHDRAPPHSGPALDVEFDSGQIRRDSERKGDRP